MFHVEDGDCGPHPEDFSKDGRPSVYTAPRELARHGAVEDGRKRRAEEPRIDRLLVMLNLMHAGPHPELAEGRVDVEAAEAG